MEARLTPIAPLGDPHLYMPPRPLFVLSNLYHPFRLLMLLRDRTADPLGMALLLCAPN